jgi:Ecdysteroid kinase-like family
MIPIPATKDDLTPEWFTSILGLTGNNHVKSVDLQPLGESYSVSGEIYRARLKYSDKQQDNPESVVLKIPQPRSLRTTWLLDAYRYEVEFYRTLAPNVGIPVPRHIYSEIDPETCDYVLVIEDFPDSTNVPDETGATKEQAYALLENMAKLHAKHWSSPEMLRRKIPTIEDSFDFLNALLAKCTPVLLSRLGRYMQPEEMEVFRALPSGFRAAVEPLLATPRTLVHNDFAMKNILIRRGVDAHSFVLVDWANLRWGPGVRDLSFFIMTSVPPSIRSRGEEEFLRHYWRMLGSGGVSDYSFKQMMEDYRRSVIMDLGRMVSFGGQEFFSPMYESILRHLIRGRTGSARELDLYSLLSH